MISIQCYYNTWGIELAHKHAKELAASHKYYQVTVTEMPDKEDNKPYYQKETVYLSTDFK